MILSFPDENCLTDSPALPFFQYLYKKQTAMRVYTYKAKVSKKGQIKVDLNPELYDKEVELTIVAKSEVNSKSTTGAMDFVKRWTGFLKNRDIDIDELKYDYLRNKYK